MEPTTTSNDILAMIAGGPNDSNEAAEGGEQDEALQASAEDGEVEPVEEGAEAEAAGDADSPGDKDPIQIRMENLERQNSILLQRLEEFSKTPAAELKEDTRKVPSIDINFQIDDDTYEKAMSSKEGFMAVLKDVAKAIHGKSAETVLLHLPQLVGNQVTSQVVLQDSVNTFWRANKDLLPQQKFAGFVYKELEAKYPDLSATEIIEKHLGSEVRKRLGLKGPVRNAGQPNPQNRPNVAGVSNGGQRLQPSKKLSGVAAEIAQMAGR